jgi:MoaA/NifB/PqqE/SkfB family radical SAM enzyme
MSDRVNEMGITKGVRKIRGTMTTFLASTVTGKIFDTIPIFITTRCDSRCQICGIWKKGNIDLDVEVINGILNDRIITRFSSFIVAGGEPLLHPRFDEIMPLFYGRKYLFLSNGLQPRKLVEAVRKYKIRNLGLSLDGTPETYKRVRGVDGFSKNEEVVKELKDDNVNIYVNFVVNPWNSREDLKCVIDFCKKYGVFLIVGYYQNIPYFGTTRPAGQLYDIDDLLLTSSLLEPRHPYFSLYHEWAAGHLRFPCFSVFLRPTIRANGDVDLCEGRESKLGNVHEKSLGEIWASRKTRVLQLLSYSCNSCWGDNQRSRDAVVASVLRSLFPPALLKAVLGRYDWEKAPLVWHW